MNEPTPAWMIAAGVALIGGLMLACAEGGSGTVIYASSRAVSGPDGGPAWWIRCNTDMGYCYKQAGKQCPAGYEQLDASGLAGSEERSSASAWGYGHSAFASGHSTVTPTFKGTMIVRCKDIDEVMAAAKRVDDERQERERERRARALERLGPRDTVPAGADASPEGI